MNSDLFFWFLVFAAINGCLVVLLAINVSRLRIVHKIAYGDGNIKELKRCIRAHANAVEQVSVYGILVAALVFSGAADWIQAIAVLAFTFFRVLHAIGMLWQIAVFRQVGALISYTLHVFVAVCLFYALLSVGKSH